MIDDLPRPAPSRPGPIPVGLGGYRLSIISAAMLVFLLVSPVGAVFSMTPITGIYQVGDVITISGMNTDNTTTFLFMIGPYLDDNGVMLTNTSALAGKGYLDTAPVHANYTWSFAWDTSLPEVDLEGGSYVVFASAAPATKKTLTGFSSAQQTFYFEANLTPRPTPTTAAPTPVPTWTPPSSGIQVMVSSNPSDDYPGRSDGDLIVYESRRGEGDSDIYLYNITSGKTTTVAIGPAYQSSPSLYGNRVVYTAYEARQFNRTDTDLFIYDVTTGQTSRLTLPGEQLYPRIYGDLLAWQDEPPGRSSVNVMLSDLVTGAKLKVPARTWVYRPDISGGTVIWTDDPTGPAIYTYDIAKEIIRKVTNRTGIQGPPMVSGSRVTWADSREDYTQIYILNFGTGSETRVTSGSSNHFTPAISGERVVWVDFRNGNRDIYEYDVASGRESEVSVGFGEQVAPQISGCTVAWADNRNGSYDVYYLKLAGCTPSPTPAPVSLEPEPTATAVPEEIPSTPAATPTTRVPTTTATTPVPPTTVPTTEAPGFGIIPACVSAAIMAIAIRRKRIR
jgi:beta propeller repeat protein